MKLKQMKLEIDRDEDRVFVNRDIQVCLGRLLDIFDLPFYTKTIWLTLYDRPSPWRVGIRKPYSTYEFYLTVDEHGEVRFYRDTKIMILKLMGKREAVYVECEYGVC